MIQPPAAVEVQRDAVPEGNDRTRASFRETEPGGVVGGIIGPPAAVSNQVIVQAEAVSLDQRTGPTTLALEAPRGEARQVNSLSRFAAADAAADKKSNAAIVPPPVPYRILRAGGDGWE